MNVDDIARYLLENNHHLVLSTASLAGAPWASPVFYVFDDDRNLYWVSSKAARHSENIRANPLTAMVITGVTPDSHSVDGLYIEATATELTDETEIIAAIDVLSQWKQPDKFTTKTPADVTGDANWRIYKATPVAVSKRMDQVEPTSGQAITIRVPVNLV